jgi:hypothetical protein
MKRISLVLLLSLFTTFAGAENPLLSLHGRRTLVFSRAQMKYGLEHNYLRRWVDRPLFQDSSLREATPNFTQSASGYRRMMNVVQSYGLDGLAFFPETSGRMGAFELTAQDAPEGFHLLPEFTTRDDLDAKRAMLQAALDCESVIRIDGRIPITAYRTDSLPLEKWRETLDLLRKEFGDQFLFLPALDRPAGKGWHYWAEIHKREEGGLPEEKKNQIKTYLREYLNLFDGLYFASAAGMKQNRRFTPDVYTDLLIELYREVLDEPGYEDKLLGLSACIGHENCTRLGYTLSQDGTKTLRRSFEAALAGQPDLIVIPEWDEENENTSIRPTVYNSLSTQRILRYYMSRIHGEAPKPNPRDDSSIPNLVISYRKILTLGEKLEIEILNVPDAEIGMPCEVMLALKDIHGQTVETVSGIHFDGDQLRDHTIVLPSERFAEHPLLVPSLKVHFRGSTRTFEKGLHPIHLRATWNWDYKWVKMPLRDLLAPVTAHFEIDPPINQPLEERIAHGVIETDEPIVSVEILDNDAVVYAADPGPTALRDRAEDVVLAIELRSFERLLVDGNLTVHGSTCTWPDDWSDLPKPPRIEGNKLSFQDNVDWRPRLLYVAIPRATASEALLEFDMPPFQTSLPVRQVLEQKIISETHGLGTTLTVSVYHRQPDHPPHLNRKRVEFTTRVVPDLTTSVYHMRAITASGRIYHSSPVRLPQAGKEEMETLWVWSDSQKKPATVQVQSVRIPDIRYSFEPERGSALTTPAGRPFWAHLGGYTDSVTGRGGNGGLDGTPFVRRAVYPKDARQMAPTWVDVDGTPALRFDGIGNFVALPQGVLPRRGAFALSLEVKPLSEQPAILFIHHGSYIGSFVLGIHEGNLWGLFVNENLDHFRFDTDLAVPVDEWSQIEAIYDLSTMRFRVDDRTSVPMPCLGPGLYDTPSAVGGYGQSINLAEFGGQIGWLQGYMRSLRVRHSSAPME